MTKVATKSNKSLLAAYAGFPTPKEGLDFEELRKWLITEETELTYAPELPSLEWLERQCRTLISSAQKGIVIHVSATKGGVGKSTTSQNLAVRLAVSGFSVCIIDACGNQQCLKWMRKRTEDMVKIPVFACSSKEVQDLAMLIDSQRQNFDFIIIDDTPGTSSITTKAMMMADMVIMPLRPKAMEMDTLKETIQHYNDASSIISHIKTIPAVILLNDDEPQTNICKQAKTTLLTVKMPVPRLYYRLCHRVKFTEAYSEGFGVSEGEYSGTDAGAEFEQVYHEILTVTVKSLYNVK